MGLLGPLFNSVKTVIAGESIAAGKLVVEQLGGPSFVVESPLPPTPMSGQFFTAMGESEIWYLDEDGHAVSPAPKLTTLKARDPRHEFAYNHPNAPVPDDTVLFPPYFIQIP